jgi:VanZ family protein
VPLVRSVQEKRHWIAAAACLLLIWASIYPARAIVDFLRGRNILRLTVAIVFLAAGCGLAAFLLRARPRWREIAALVFGGLAYAVVLAIMNQPEERLHFLEYGALAGFTEAALRARRAAMGGALGALPSLLAILITAGLGWLDEIIQYFVPVRVYDWRDVGFNAAAGALLVGLAALRRRARQRDEGEAGRLAVLVGAVIAMAAAGAPAAEAPRPTNVLLITLDAQRADHLGCYGYPRPTSPRIDELARAGAVFRQAVGHANWTGPGVVTLLTGLAPAVHGMDTRHKAMDRHFPTPLKELARRGWQVGGFQGRVEPYVNLGLGERDLMGTPIAEQLRERAAGGSSCGTTCATSICLTTRRRSCASSFAAPSRRRSPPSTWR